MSQKLTREQLEKMLEELDASWFGPDYWGQILTHDQAQRETIAELLQALKLARDYIKRMEWNLGDCGEYQAAVKAIASASTSPRAESGPIGAK